MKKYYKVLQIIIFALTVANLVFFNACSSKSMNNRDMMESEVPYGGEEIIVDANGNEIGKMANGNYNGEKYLEIVENKEISTEQEFTVTFSLKIDTAAYTNISRYINSGNLPPKDAVRTEELVNYFNYDTELYFNGDSPFAVHSETGRSFLNTDKYMAFVRIKTKDIDKNRLPACNLTFLIDTSGSMDSYDKLPLLKESFKLLVDTLSENDKVSIVTYAGNVGVALDSVSGTDKKAILNAIDRLQSGGSTAGSAGILTAYALAEKNFKDNGNNRIILATDGDFNVGISDIEELKKLIGHKKDSGIYLSVLGFGTGNIRDDIMETLSKNGNGNYSYINNLSTAKKVLVEELASNLFTAADDVKAQIEFNPDYVKSYRLIGYENRMMENKDFTDDAKNAGEIGAGTDIVLMYELDFRQNVNVENIINHNTQRNANIFEVRIRYKTPGESESKQITEPVTFSNIRKNNSSDFNFASSIAAFSHKLRDSEYAKDITAEKVISLAENNLGNDLNGYRKEFIDLLKKWKNLLK